MYKMFSDTFDKHSLDVHLKHQNEETRAGWAVWFSNRPTDLKDLAYNLGIQYRDLLMWHDGNKDLMYSQLMKIEHYMDNH